MANSSETPRDDDRRQDAVTLYKHVLADGETGAGVYGDREAAIPSLPPRLRGNGDEMQPFQATFSRVERYQVLYETVVRLPPEQVHADLKKKAWTPTGPLDIPPFSITNGYWDHYQAEFVSRVDAFATAAEHNAEKLQSKERCPSWAFVIEFGDPIDGLLVTGQVGLADGVGVAELPQYTPVRLAKPTAEEIEQYSVDREFVAA